MFKSLILIAAVATPLALWAGGKQCPFSASSCGEKASLVSTGGEQCTDKTAACAEKASIVSTGGEQCADKAAACAEKASAVSTGGEQCADKAACAEKTCMVSTGEKAGKSDCSASTGTGAKAACCPSETAARSGAMLVSTGAAQPMETLKSLAGKWNLAKADRHADAPADFEFKVSSGGSAIVETMFPGTPKEMTNVYTLDGNDVLVTHYCAAGNAPRMKLTHNENGTMTFDFVDATNLPDKNKMYMGKLELKFVGPDQVRQTWTTFVNGQPSDQPMTMTLERAK